MSSEAYITTTLVQFIFKKKNDTDVVHYNYAMHEGILIIFSRYVTKK